MDRVILIDETSTEEPIKKFPTQAQLNEIGTALVNWTCNQDYNELLKAIDFLVAAKLRGEQIPLDSLPSVSNAVQNQKIRLDLPCYGNHDTTRIENPASNLENLVSNETRFRHTVTGQLNLILEALGKAGITVSLNSWSSCNGY